MQRPGLEKGRSRSQAVFVVASQRGTRSPGLNQPDNVSKQQDDDEGSKKQRPLNEEHSRYIYIIVARKGSL